MASGGEECDPKCSNVSVGTRCPAVQGRSREGAYLIHLESLIERPWRACEGDGGLKRPQPLAGRVRRLVRYGNIAQVIHMVFHQLGVGRLPHAPVRSLDIPVLRPHWERGKKKHLGPHVCLNEYSGMQGSPHKIQNELT